MSTPTQRRESKWFSSYDAFPKIEVELQSSTESGGVVSIVLFIVLFLLAGSEFLQYRSVQHDYEFVIDQTMAHQMDVYIDISIATECQYLRADVLDVSRTSLPITSKIRQEPVVYHTLGVEQLESHLAKNRKTNDVNVAQLMRQRYQDHLAQKSQAGKKNGCRFYGSFPVNKLHGMIHFTASGFGYVGMRPPIDAVNFTHRIDELSFGKHYPGLVNPLDYTHETATSHLETFQYFLGLVPTIFVDNLGVLYQRTILTNQYAVTEFAHVIDIEKPDSVPGIFVQYDIEPISVRITANRMSLLQFLTRLCGVVGGVFIVFGMCLRAYQSLVSFFVSPRD
ncbi:endoplasmic reticulum vesicle transporter-domain-containing protein [Gorgonomyces haynaldii]|nr:endoplasmic reticulum vesicle transporter-domain-containing protein [Gorgonomyces haynaldii]